jgi:hypothetical protein
VTPMRRRATRPRAAVQRMRSGCFAEARTNKPKMPCSMPVWARTGAPALVFHESRVINATNSSLCD